LGIIGLVFNGALLALVNSGQNHSRGAGNDFWSVGQNFGAHLEYSPEFLEKSGAFKVEVFTGFKNQFFIKPNRSCLTRLSDRLREKRESRRPPFIF